MGGYVYGYNYNYNYAYHHCARVRGDPRSATTVLFAQGLIRVGQVHCACVSSKAMRKVGARRSVFVSSQVFTYQRISSK